MYIGYSKISVWPQHLCADIMVSMQAPPVVQESEISMAEAKAIGFGKVTFVNNPVKVFGIVFNHAFPLDLSIIKYCFQGCPFCFATANKRFKGDVIGKKEDPLNQFFKLMEKANGQGYDPHSFMEYVVRKKMPIIFSNNVDPFLPASELQFKLGERVLTECLRQGQRLFIQTKEVYPNEKVKELLIQGKDLFQVYVSLSTLDYDTAKKYETVAVTPQQRLERIAELTKHGVQVIAALNPYVPEWVNLKEYVAAVKDAGCSGVFAYPLHLTSAQMKVMPKRFEPFAKLANRYEQFDEEARIIKGLTAEAGIGFYEPYHFADNAYYKGATAWKLPDVGWPIDAHWIHAEAKKVYDEEKAPVFIHWAFVDRFFSRFPEWEAVFNINDFAGVLWTDNDSYFAVKSTLGKKNKIKNIVRFIWNNHDLQDKFMSFFADCFVLADGDGADEIDFVTDDNGDKIWVYDPKYRAHATYWDQSDSETKDIEPIWLE